MSFTSDFLGCCFSNFMQCNSGNPGQCGLAAEGNSAELDSCQPDAVPDHRPRDLNGNQVGGLGLPGQVGGQADFQLKIMQNNDSDL